MGALLLEVETGEGVEVGMGVVAEPDGFVEL